MKSSPEKLTGVSHFLAAASYSLGGLRRLLREAAFRQELLFFAVCLVLITGAGATSLDYLVTIILFLILFAVEALNTAVEEVIDRISPEVSAVGKHAKDLGSFAVLCLLTSTGLFVLYTILNRMLLL